MGLVLVAFGGLVVALGGVLVWGNLSGQLRTLPFVGTLTIVAGLSIISFGRRKHAETYAGLHRR
jgi:drug/metabolite transporter superfamily protein YnfA